MEQIEHFSHEHPLMLCENGKDSTGLLKLCYFCSKPVGDTTHYICTRCEFYVLHKSCAELPRNIITPLHPRHPLSLSKHGYFTCDHCYRYSKGFFYHCSLCDIELHSECASQHIFQPEGHEHSFILLRPTSFTCDACGDHSYGFSYLCTACHLQVHKTCTSFPHTVKQIGHDHPLKLTYSIQLNDSLDQSCKICYRKMKTELCFYNCESCSYFAHVKCATSKDLGQVKILQEDEDENEQKFGLTSSIVKGISLAENHIVKELNHSSHEHCLTLSNQEPKNDEICDGCVQTISVPYYRCEQCNFFLHSSCAKLPRQILSPLHPHPLRLVADPPRRLKLIVKPPQPDPHLFLCNACRLYCNGFSYKCDKCWFFLDVKCGAISDSLRHRGHEHTLRLIPEQKHILSRFQKSSIAKCNACGLDCHARFTCVECNLNLDLQCASLPYTANHECPKHKWNIHPLHLTFGSAEYETGEYYCDICEEERGQNDWFYYCVDCDYQVHPSCILGKHNIKSGKSTYEHDNHPHPLTLVKTTKGHPVCSICSLPCKEFFLQCAQCSFNIHRYHYESLHFLRFIDVVRTVIFILRMTKIIGDR